MECQQGFERCSIGMAPHSHHFRIEAPLQAGSYDKAAVQARIQREITSAPVVFYSYSLSPFCTQTKELGGMSGDRGWDTPLKF